MRVQRRVFAGSVLGLLVMGCAPDHLRNRPSGDAPAGTPQPSGSASPSPTATPDPVVTIIPNVSSGSTDVSVDHRLKITVEQGKLTGVKVTGKGRTNKGAETNVTVDGDLTEGEWQASTRLQPATAYTIEATGIGTDGRTKTNTLTFSTVNLSLKEQIFPSIYPESGTVGVAMPVMIKFDLPVADRASFARHLKVTTTPVQEGAWVWLSDTEVHWRPKDFFQAGTKVKVEADLQSVPAGGGKFGQLSRTVEFAVGKAQQTEVNLATKQLVQKVNGQVVRTVPISAGKPGFITRSGTKVVSEKLPQTRMASETIGISNNDPTNGYDLQVKWAIRITDSGEFLHAAPWNMGKFGKENSSHGCIGMSDADAQALFGIIQVGDPVVVTGSDRPLEPQNGITDWNVSWEKWKSWA
ncbi:L,D-transpeptidase family protein [Naumannella sp. ID2617S]|nr:L,D-transpeptidase family protein [Naumannella sp. ID2617S]